MGLLETPLLARPNNNLDATAAARLVGELDEAIRKLRAARHIVGDVVDDAARAEAFAGWFTMWLNPIEQRRALVAALYPDSPSMAQGG